MAHALAEERPTALEAVPAAHGTGVVDPRGQKLPAVHVKQPVAPAALWYRPAGHSEHRASSALAAKVPGEHGVACGEPVGQYVPRGQVMHCEAETITASDELMCRPAEQGSGADAPSAQKYPPVHVTQADLPLTLW